MSLSLEHIFSAVNPKQKTILNPKTQNPKPKILNSKTRTLKGNINKSKIWSLSLWFRIYGFMGLGFRIKGLAVYMIRVENLGVSDLGFSISLSGVGALWPSTRQSTPSPHM